MIDSGAASVYAIVLAAGASTRFGSPKQLARLGGKTLLHRAINAATETVGPAVRVVLGAHAMEIAATLDCQADQVAINTRWAEGIASSIRFGVKQLPENCAAALFLLADQPFVTGASLAHLMTIWRTAPGDIVASGFGAVVGVPCLFPRWCFGELETFDAIGGARAVIARHPSRVRVVHHPEAALDIDTPLQLSEQQPVFAE